MSRLTFQRFAATLGGFRPLPGERPKAKLRRDDQGTPQLRLGRVDAGRLTTKLCRENRGHEGLAIRPKAARQRHRSEDNLLRVGGPRQWHELRRVAPSLPGTNPRRHSQPWCLAGRLAVREVYQWPHQISSIQRERRAGGQLHPTEESGARRQLRTDVAADRCLPPSGSFFIGCLGLRCCPGNIFTLEPLLQFGTTGAEKFNEGGAHEFVLRMKPAIADHPGDVGGDLIRHFDVERFHSEQVNLFRK